MSKLNNLPVFLVLFVSSLLLGCASVDTIHTMANGQTSSATKDMDPAPSLRGDIVNLAEHIKSREQEVLSVSCAKPEILPPAGLQRVKFYLDKASESVDSIEYPYFNRSLFRKDIDNINKEVEKVINLKETAAK